MKRKRSRKFGNTLNPENELFVIPDLEGSLDKLMSFINIVSKNIFENDPTFEFPNGVKVPLKLKNNKRIIVLGDVTDNHKYNYSVLGYINKLKEINEDTVILIMGNRDLNKLRLPYSLRTFVPSDDSGNEFRISSWKNDYETFIKGKDPTPIVKLQFIFEKTMGAPNYIKNLKLELKELGLPYNDSDTISFITNEIIPMYAKYLKNSFIIYHDPITNGVYSHGSLTTKNFLKVPYSNSVNFYGVDSWISAINKWAHDIIVDQVENEYNNLDKVLPLIEYQEPFVLNGKWTVDVDGKGISIPNSSSVVVGRPWKFDNVVANLDKMTENGIRKAFKESRANFGILPINTEVCEVLLQNNINKMVFGHSPVGDIPFFIKTDIGGIPFYTVACDTTYVSHKDRIGIIRITPTNIRVEADFIKVLKYVQDSSIEDGKGKMNGSDVSISYKLSEAGVPIPEVRTGG